MKSNNCYTDVAMNRCFWSLTLGAPGGARLSINDGLLK